MSQRALLLAVRDHLRAARTTENPTATVSGGLGLPNEWCEISIDGKPWADVGEYFVAVAPASFNSTGTSTECLDEEIEVLVVVSCRSCRIPEDRWGSDLLTPAVIKGTEYPGLLAACEAIRATIHLNYDVIDRANNYINETNPGQPTNGFEEPLFFGSISRPEKKGGSWFSANAKERYAGISMTVSFRPARRTQRADLQT